MCHMWEAHYTQALQMLDTMRVRTHVVQNTPRIDNHMHFSAPRCVNRIIEVWPTPIQNTRSVLTDMY